ncbi:tripartite motif-containing protein 16-like isoform X2 [Erpetoichthys calabaricus]|uniref:tripartite motif-containing protein 16-like isoform X2 n=1 Tax=Erpetoichthys calabaricus TaxID=27687 RepID=UPI002233FB4F|nr:tripartite motif-containing protein 16-like isoform X2 [Erpetoichthys calabaricus]
MAKAQLFVSQDEFICSLCQDTLTDPVTIPCGHNFCLKCLTNYWDQSQECSCPQCRENFITRPELKRNTLLNEVIKKLKKTALSSPPFQNYAGPGDVKCDFCTGKKFRAVKSCLTCMASYCQTHLQPHYEVAALKHHKLVDPDGNLRKKLCEKHQKSLEIFCKTDETCICMMCGMTEHDGHEKVELETEREEKQKQLRATLRGIRRRLEKKEKKMKEMRRTAEQMKISVERVMEEHEKSFTDLIRCIEEANKKLTEKIREQEKREMEKAEGVMEQLKKEIEELKRREAELKELSETKDHLHFLQKQLGATLREIRRRLEKKEKKMKEMRRTVEEMKISVQREMEENEKSFTALIRCIEEAHRKLTERIREQEKREMEKAEGVMERLEKEIEQLKRKEAELKELSETKDHVHFLQTFSSRCVLPANGDSLSYTVTTDFSSEGLRKELSGLKKSLEKISQEDIMTRTLSGAPHLKPSVLGWLLGHQRVKLNTSGGAHTGHDTAPGAPRVTTPNSAHPLRGPTFPWQRLQRTNAHDAPVFALQPPEPQSRDDFLKYFCPLTLDINTAHRELRLSEGNKKVTFKGTKAKYPDHPDRFDCWYQVLCREALTGTRCYWEVEGSGDFMRIGVACKGLSRKGWGNKCGLGYNNKSWCLLWSDSQYSVRYNNQHTVISAPYSPRIGVYLDWPAGSLSFYSVSHTMTLLHRINTSFTEPLYPGFGFGLHSSVTISHLTSCDH